MAITWMMASLLLQTFAAFLLGTILFDFLHYLLHRFLRSNSALLKKIGRLHTAHHAFYPATLKIHPEWAKKNILQHVVIEYVTQVCGTLMFIAAFDAPAILFAIIAETIIFIAVCIKGGVDPHHQPYEQLPADRGGIFVSAAYHALHHVYPNQYYSSYIKVIDWIFGAGHQLGGKHIVMTGASGALGKNMKRLLEREGVTVTALKFGADYTYENYDQLNSQLEKADILFLCHGSKYEFAQQANCDSYVRIIELYKAIRPRGLVPSEIWATGSEIECHPCFGIEKIKVYAASKRNYARKARDYFYESDVQYRHLVHSAFMSQMGPGLMSANFAAHVTLFLLKRGFKYVPVTYTGFAFLNYGRFRLHRLLRSRAV